MSRQSNIGAAATTSNGTKNSYAQYLVQPNGLGAQPQQKQQRRAGKEWLPYSGQRQLIIAIDLGTTYSGASYCILEPGKRPKIEDVRAWPGQPSHLCAWMARGRGKVLAEMRTAARGQRLGC